MSGERAILGEVTGQGGCLLRAEVVPAPRAPAGLCRGVVLTFDVGVFIVEPAPDGRELRVAPLRSEHSPGDEGLPADEEEPWWALLGQPLVRARERLAPDGTRASVDLQFRPDDANPRVVALSLAEDALRISARSGVLDATGP